VQVALRQTGEWRISPAIPAVANLVLAVLWAFTALGGWAEQAFCGVGDAHDQVCVVDVHDTDLVSPAAVVPAAGIILASVVFTSIRRVPDHLTGMLTAAAFMWAIAEGIVFLGVISPRRADREPQRCR